MALIVGNWKMNGLRADRSELETLIGLVGRKDAGDAIVGVCPPATLLAGFAEMAADTPIRVGGQDCHAEASGAYTGDISAKMLRDAGATYVIVGHSERRALHGETDAVVRAKAEAALQAGLVPILCVGETETERREGRQEEVVGTQLAGSVPEWRGRGELVVAYEPVWAIGTGLTPTDADIAAMHAFIRARVGVGVPLLYGGSVKPSNAAQILALPDVDGALVGGASLKAADFFGIVSAAPTGA